MRNPNGYGTIYKDNSTKRRKPYIVRKVDYYDLNGKAHYIWLGSFEKRQDAMNFLAEYNMTPHEKAQKMTFSQVYDLWSAKHYQKIKNVQPYIKAYERSSVLYDKFLNEITQSALQGVIDDFNDKGAKVNLKLLYSLMWDYAERNEIVTPDKNRTKYLEVPTQTKSNKHTRFTNEELKTLWENKDDKVVQTILVLIYTGCRPMELFKTTEFNETYFEIHEGKTINAIRVVPIHKAISKFVPLSVDIKTQSQYNSWVKNTFNSTMERLGMEHTPYDCRHTFASLWADNGLNEMYRRFIQGHSTNGIGEQVYTHLSNEVLWEEVNKLPTF